MPPGTSLVSIVIRLPLSLKPSKSIKASNISLSVMMPTSFPFSMTGSVLILCSLILTAASSNKLSASMVITFFVIASLIVILDRK